MRYALLLRGINVGGKHKVSMDRLKADLMELGFRNVVSYINSGNLFFDSSEPEEVIQRTLARYFDATYDFPVPFIIISAAMLQQEVAQLPSWWQDDTAYRRDALFYLPEADKTVIEAETATPGRTIASSSILGVRRSFIVITIRPIILHQTTIKSYSKPGFISSSRSVMAKPSRR